MNLNNLGLDKLGDSDIGMIVVIIAIFVGIAIFRKLMKIGILLAMVIGAYMLFS